MESSTNPLNKENVLAIENPAGIQRKALSYNKDLLLCNFDMRAGSKIPLHSHIHSQCGYVISGKLKFFTEKEEFVVKSGDSYIFNGNEKHGAEIIQDSEVIEIFVPCRDEYLNK